MRPLSLTPRPSSRSILEFAQPNVRLLDSHTSSAPVLTSEQVSDFHSDLERALALSAKEYQQQQKHQHLQNQQQHSHAPTMAAADSSHESSSWISLLANSAKTFSSSPTKDSVFASTSRSKQTPNRKNSLPPVFDKSSKISTTVHVPSSGRVGPQSFLLPKPQPSISAPIYQMERVESNGLGPSRKIESLQTPPSAPSSGFLSSDERMSLQLLGPIKPVTPAKSANSKQPNSRNTPIRFSTPRTSEYSSPEILLSKPLSRRKPPTTTPTTVRSPPPLPYSQRCHGTPEHAATANILSSTQQFANSLVAVADVDSPSATKVVKSPAVSIKSISSSVSSVLRPRARTSKNKFSFSFLDSDEEDEKSDNCGRRSPFARGMSLVDDDFSPRKSPVPTSSRVESTPRRRVATSSLSCDGSSPVIVSWTKRSTGKNENGSNVVVVLDDNDENDGDFSSKKREISSFYTGSNSPLSGRSVPCPVCGSKFSAREIQTHADLCAQSCLSSQEVLGRKDRFPRRTVADATSVGSNRIADIDFERENTFKTTPNPDGNSNWDYDIGVNEDADKDMDDSYRNRVREQNPQLSPLKGFVNLNELKQKGELGSLEAFFNQFSAPQATSRRRRGGSSTVGESGVTPRTSRAGVRKKWPRSRPQSARRGRSAASGSTSRNSTASTRHRHSDASYNYYADHAPDLSAFPGAGEMRWESGITRQL
ncbi:hypothetical protein HDU84_005371 [Entophlyctis sp. JEL0112]|nr:hypothetical protein HDU84_005371 [Entophlyctis sp. JEL0112]